MGKADGAEALKVSPLLGATHFIGDQRVLFILQPGNFSEIFMTKDPKTVAPVEKLLRKESIAKREEADR